MPASSAATFSRDVLVAAKHPSLEGHFPGDPVVPGVVLLDLVGDVLQQWKPGSRIIGIAQAKFYQLLRPEQQITISLYEQKPNNIQFECFHGQQKIAAGVMNIETSS